VTPEAQVRLQQVQAAVTALTLLAENFRYQFVFRLPLPPAIEVPGQDPSPERRMAERVDAAIDRILGGFGISAQVLDEPTAQERAAEAVATVERIVAEGIQVPRQVAEAIGQPAG
jgi:predicted component of type VI protein secretion system